jgi:hypothetical protein
MRVTVAFGSPLHIDFQKVLSLAMADGEQAGQLEV